MEASELKIGNLIYKCYPEGNEVVEVKNISENFVNSLGISSIKPIPLTEEWLLNFGFTRHHADYSNNIIYIKNLPDNTEFEWGVYPNELGSGIQIQNRKLLKHVHHLQNLYFALTGEELTIKE